jgi:hypothetical protein
VIGKIALRDLTIFGALLLVPPFLLFEASKVYIGCRGIRV